MLKKKVLVVLGIVCALMIVAVGILFAIPTTRNFIIDFFSTPQFGEGKPLPEEYRIPIQNPEAVLEALSKSQVIKDIPSNGKVLVRVGGTAYTASDGKITLGAPTSPDIALLLPFSYERDLLNRDLCDVTHDASVRKELLIQTYSSKAHIAWTYSSLEKYRICI